METSAKTTYFGNEVEINFPNIAQYIEIERLKTTITDARYPLMAVSPLESTRTALHLVDAIAYGSVLLGSAFYPPLNEVDLKKVLEISMADERVVELLRWYRKEYSQFHNGIEKRKDRPAETVLDELEAKAEEKAEKGKTDTDGTQS